jgi:hypothetical protein
MDATYTLTEFFGWCSVINVALLASAAIAILLFAGPVRRIHSGMFGISEDDLPRAYFEYLARYKLGILIFNIVPYIALRLME